MINEQDKQRIEKEAFELSEYASHYALYNSGIKDGYVAGATAELERSEKLLQEHREVIRELLPLADVMVFEMRGTVNDDVTQKCKNKVERAKSLLHQPNRAI